MEEAEAEPLIVPSLSTEDGMAVEAATAINESDHEHGNASSAIIEAGNVGTFLVQACSNGMSNERFVGPVPAPPPRDHSGKETDDPHNEYVSVEHTSDDTPTQQQSHSASHPYQNLVTISRFVSDFKARKTIAGNRLSEGFRRSHNADNESSAEETDRYISAVTAFAQTQMDRQNAGLGSNARVESAGRLLQLVQSHASAMNAAMMHAEMEMMKGEFKIPGKDTLCLWHSLLCPNHEQSGKFRTTSAKAGKTLFCPPDKLESEFQSFATAMEELYSKWSNQILVGASSPVASAGPQREESLIISTYYSVSLAAVMLYGIMDIHPFADGNGRLGRICTNWVLRRILGLPFTITITVNPTQRAEYMAGLKTSLRWIVSLKDVDPSNPDFPLSVTHGAKQASFHIENGIFQDLIHVLLDRVAHACNECQRVITEKSDAAVANEEARIARQVREKAAAGQCVICLEENPNILTVCCGQACHLNCLAEWLGTASNCVACRKPLPTLQVRQHNQEEEAPPAEIDAPGVPQPINAHANPRNDVWNRVLTNMLWEAAESADDMFCDNDECQNRAASDCPNFMCRVCCQSYGREDCERHFPHLQEMDESSSTQTAMSPVADDDEPVSPRSQALPRCRRCSNRAAMDCENQMCGRHCVLRGWHSCSRHNTIR